MVTRRSFVAAAGAATLLPACAALAGARTGVDAPPPPPLPPTAAAPYIFFDATEARFVESACARLIPADARRPGAPESGACLYLDAELAGPWGTGEQLHRTGRWQPGTPAPPSSACSPSRFFRAALHDIDLELRRRARPFHRMPPPAQDAFLAALRHGEPRLSVSSREFFELLLQLTVEGFFSRPQSGPPPDRIPWQLSSFPGAFSTRS